MKKSITAHNSEETINIKQYKIWYIICTSELHTNLFISSNKEDLVETQLGEDDDDDDDNNKTFLWNSLSTKGRKPYSQLETLSEILTIGNLRLAARRI